MRHVRFWIKFARVFLWGPRLVLPFRCVRCHHTWRLHLPWNETMGEFDWPEETTCPVCALPCP